MDSPETVPDTGSGEPDPVQGELDALQRRMDEIREEAAQDVDENWTSTWRNPEVFDLKVRTRLSGHSEYQSLLERRRQIEAHPSQPAQPDQ